MSDKNYFKKSEHTCRCGCGLYNMHPFHIDMLNRARIIAGIKFKINSGSRCPTHNINVNGSDDSEHLYGHGSDIEAITSMQRFKILHALIKVGFKRIGIKKTFIHAGTSNIHPEGVIWL